MLTSVIVLASTPSDAVRYIEQECPEALTHADVERVFEVERVIVCWPTHTISIVQK